LAEWHCSAVSLAMNSDVSGDDEMQTFDLCCKYGSEYEMWYKSQMSQDDRNMKAFPQQ
jgi:hypothetical protein